MIFPPTCGRRAGHPKHLTLLPNDELWLLLGPPFRRLVQRLERLGYKISIEPAPPLGSAT